jgi:hypothetical protein
MQIQDANYGTQGGLRVKAGRRLRFDVKDILATVEEVSTEEAH